MINSILPAAILLNLFLGLSWIALSIISDLHPSKKRKNINLLDMLIKINVALGLAISLGVIHKNYFS